MIPNRVGAERQPPSVEDFAGENNGTLRSQLKIYNSSGVLVASATEDASTLFETYSGLLPGGKYYAEISCFGGHVEVRGPAEMLDPKHFYDMGAYFLTGSGFVSSPTAQLNDLIAKATSIHGTIGCS